MAQKPAEETEDECSLWKSLKAAIAQIINGAAIPMSQSQPDDEWRTRMHDKIRLRKCERVKD